MALINTAANTDFFFKMYSIYLVLAILVRIGSTEVIKEVFNITANHQPLYALCIIKELVTLESGGMLMQPLVNITEDYELEENEYILKNN